MVRKFVAMLAFVMMLPFCMSGMSKVFEGFGVVMIGDETTAGETATVTSGLALTTGGAEVLEEYEGESDDANVWVASEGFELWTPLDMVATIAQAESECEAQTAPFRTAGNYVTFGKYPQTESGTDATPIEWLVLEYDEANDCALLISRYGLDAQPYNIEDVDVTWETCTLRKWLNEDFLVTAFSAEERAKLVEVSVPNPGSDTRDTVFLLSINEVNALFSGDGARMCGATAYAKAQGAYVSDNGNSWWWLRSPGGDSNYAAYVNSDDVVCDIGNYVNRGYNVVRPVVVLRLS